MMNPFKVLYKLFRLLSLDVALGAVIMTNSVSHVYGVTLPLSVSIALFFAVWFIYTLDHWLDARRLTGEPSMPRHKFHLEHTRSIIILMSLQLIFGALNMIYLPVQTIYLGLVACFSVGIYFLFSVLFRVILIKEVLIASIYATGVYVGPVSLGAIRSLDSLITILMVFGLAFVNLILLAMYEVSNDIKDGSHSWPIRFGYKSSYFLLNYLLYGLLVMIAFSSIYLTSSSWGLYLSFFIMTVVLYFILNKQKWFRQHERYRIYADMIFFIPGVVLFF